MDVSGQASWTKRKGRRRVRMTLAQLIVIMLLVAALVACLCYLLFLVQSMSQAAFAQENTVMGIDGNGESGMNDGSGINGGSGKNSGEKASEAFDPLVLVNREHAYNAVPGTLVNAYERLWHCVTLKEKTMQIDATAAEAAEKMFRAAREDGLTKMMVISAYRSVAYQQDLFWQKRRLDPTYGMELAIPVSVMPGESSEHATGLAMDIARVGNMQLTQGQEKSREYQWLLAHCADYGFILRYPQGKEHLTGVIYEPWHFRYVGVAAAKAIMEGGLCLEEYWDSQAK